MPQPELWPPSTMQDLPFEKPLKGLQFAVANVGHGPIIELGINSLLLTDPSRQTFLKFGTRAGQSRHNRPGWNFHDLTYLLVR